jgi:hypothetical protein
MGRRILSVVLLTASGTITVAIFAVAPVYASAVLAAAH